MLEWIATHEFTLIGVIFMLVIGPAVGNYACSVVYRLPRGKTPFERHPYCGHCNADLKPIDLFPILSWLMTKGKCRYCSGEIPAIYTIIELVCGIVFTAYFLKFGISESFLLYSAFATFVVILAAIQWQQGWVAATIYSYAIGIVALLRTLHEHTIYGFVQSTFIMLTLALLIARFTGIKKIRKKFQPFEVPWIWWLVLLGALVPMPQWYTLVLIEWKLLAPIYLLAFITSKKSELIFYTFAALTLPLFL